ncbi:hypothetical protein AB0L41_16920 [Amycolatopsis mediterranei]|uniref:hypothetical protein n=1 Tax=Amycolatopsis mediterranei TaxID=33910 RepID=UPI0034156CD9
MSNLTNGIADWNVVFVVDSERWSTWDRLPDDEGLTLGPIGRIDGRPGVRWHDGRGRVLRSRPVVNEHFVGRLEDEAEFLDRIRFERLFVEAGF